MSLPVKNTDRQRSTASDWILTDVDLSASRHLGSDLSGDTTSLAGPWQHVHRSSRDPESHCPIAGKCEVTPELLIMQILDDTSSPPLYPKMRKSKVPVSESKLLVRFLDVDSAALWPVIRIL